ncbi:hypothetical protein J6590_090891 [Homalodisca vitripennis]|nr:hypothetical protein J6590_090891 [Homalodisca vitripennis]
MHINCSSLTAVLLMHEEFYCDIMKAVLFQISEYGSLLLSQHIVLTAYQLQFSDRSVTDA